MSLILNSKTSLIFSTGRGNVDTEGLLLSDLPNNHAPFIEVIQNVSVFTKISSLSSLNIFTNHNISRKKSVRSANILYPLTSKARYVPWFRPGSQKVGRCSMYSGCCALEGIRLGFNPEPAQYYLFRFYPQWRLKSRREITIKRFLIAFCLCLTNKLVPTCWVINYLSNWLREVFGHFQSGETAERLKSTETPIPPEKALFQP